MTASILLGGQIDRIPGAHDDNTDDGVLRTKLALGEVVFVPPSSPILAETSGSSVAIYQPGPQAGAEGGQGGLPGSMHFNVGAGSQKYAIATFTFYGRFFGMAILNRPQSTTQRFWDVEIDMTTYAGRKPGANFNGDAQTGSVYHESITAVPIATDLGDHQHTARIGCGSDASVNNHLHVLGFYLDARYYEQPQPAAVPSELVTLSVASGTTPDMTTEGTLLPHDPPTLTTPSVTAEAGRRYRSLECVEFIGGASASDADIYQQLADGTWTRRWRASGDPWCDGVPALGSAYYKPATRFAVGTAFKAIIPFGSAAGVRVATWGATR